MRVALLGMMRGMVGVLCFATLCAAAQTAGKPTALTPPARTPLRREVDALTADAGVARAHWGVAVMGLDGTLLEGVNEGQFFRPASNAKLFTTAAALRLLHGDEAVYRTRVLGVYDEASASVTGDLTLVGGGDPGFGGDDLPYVPPGAAKRQVRRAFDDLHTMAEAVVAKGVRHVTGDIVGDDTLFPYEPYGESWAADDLVWGFGAPVSALTVASNQLRLSITPGAAGAAATLVLEQGGVPYYTLQSEVRTVAAKSKVHGIAMERAPGSRVVRVFGTIPADADADVEYVAIDDPAAFAAVALRGMLVEAGVRVDGEARAHHRLVVSGTGFREALLEPLDREAAVLRGEAPGRSCTTGSPPPGSELAAHVSAPLEQDVVFTSKTSQNLHAELMLHHLGLLQACGDGSGLLGARMVRAFLLRAGVDGGDFIFFDGSGLSAHDLVTPRATVKLLAYASRQGWGGAFRASLPVGGTDGSLAGRFSTGLKGRVFAKTGTLGESRALSGYVVAASGRTVAFSVMVDEHAPGSTADRTAMDKIVEAIAAAY